MLKKKTSRKKPTKINPVEDMPKAIETPKFYTIDFAGDGFKQQIQIEWTEYTELPEVLHKWLKKQGIDNRLINL